MPSSKTQPTSSWSLSWGFLQVDSCDWVWAGKMSSLFALWPSSVLLGGRGLVLCICISTELLTVNRKRERVQGIHTDSAVGSGGSSKLFLWIYPGNSVASPYCFCWKIKVWRPSEVLQNWSSKLRRLLKFPLLFLKTVLLRYNSHTIQFTHLKCTMQWFVVYAGVQPSPQSILEHSLIQKGNRIPISFHSPFLPNHFPPHRHLQGTTHLPLI